MGDLHIASAAVPSRQYSTGHVDWNFAGSIIVLIISEIHNVYISNFLFRFGATTRTFSFLIIFQIHQNFEIYRRNPTFKLRKQHEPS